MGSEGKDALAGPDGEADRFYKENRLRPALYYRITRKRIAIEIIKRTMTFVDILSSIPSDGAEVSGNFDPIMRTFEDILL